ncbi:hypothetical protein [Alteromonas gilva]|uniref:Uncharacterized protein n=1 Tax=Alteromonas gilva TaxID=2987522 RepID=A0ABT5L409_9ALTE|nr:hypothetical protein [Alteromonas gilva]MDC8831781.1 hypothetical protein [Alteromonas gilva]
MAVKQTQTLAHKRERSPGRQKGFYRVELMLNTLAWLVLLVCLILFHFARPEMVTGVQQFWGVEARTYWSGEHVAALATLLQVSLMTTLITMLLRYKRKRSKSDRYGVHLFILAGISAACLLTLHTTVIA